MAMFPLSHMLFAPLPPSYIFESIAVRVVDRVSFSCLGLRDNWQTMLQTLTIEFHQIYQPFFHFRACSLCLQASEQFLFYLYDVTKCHDVILLFLSLTICIRTDYSLVRDVNLLCTAMCIIMVQNYLQHYHEREI